MGLSLGPFKEHHLEAYKYKLLLLQFPFNDRGIKAIRFGIS
jgi:hypothetical protein